MDTVILINPFEVPAGKEEALRFWEQAAEYMRRQPGFISTRLHKPLSPDARFTYVNIAEWESAEHFEAAISRLPPGTGQPARCKRSSACHITPPEQEIQAKDKI